jgi:hypothetical protein
MQGGADAISAAAIAQRARMGADLFFHTHPNVGINHRPHLSPGDISVAINNGMFFGAAAFSNNKYYWFDGKGIKR